MLLLIPFSLPMEWCGEQKKTLMINLKLGLGRKELLIRFGNKKGRPKRTLFLACKDFAFFLKKVYQDNRFTGNKVSRVLRRIFEVRKIKEIMGANLALAVFFTGTLGQPISALNLQDRPENVIYTVNEVQIITQASVRDPLETFEISQGYHLFHKAIDLRADWGEVVYPMMTGRVEEVVYSRFGYGNSVIVDHGSSFKSLYAHLGKIEVEEGQSVEQETILGTIGMTGWTTGPHLHLEIWEDEKPINPLTILR